MEYQYKKEDSFFEINKDDASLATIRIKLPSLTEWYSNVLGRPVSREEALTYVDGYGLPPERQKFEYVEIPKKLKDISKVIKRSSSVKIKTITRDHVFTELDENRDYYKDEIAWIKRDIKRRFLGYWVFINGKPTYIDGWHYFYMNYWDIQSTSREDGLPEYRDVDRRLFLFSRYCYTTTEAWYRYRVSYRKNGKVDYKYYSERWAAEEFMKMHPEAVMEGGSPIEEDGEKYPHPGFTVDKGYRTIYGYNHPKRRRRGATSAAVCISYLIVTEGRGRHGGFQSLNWDKAKDDVYADKLVRPWNKIPVWHKPAHDGSDRPKEGLLFAYPPTKTHGGISDRLPSHDGWIEPRSSTERAFDGTRLHVIIRDEGGKTEGNNIYDLNEWWEVHKKCISQGFTIHGLAIIPSTVGEMDSGGGSQYAKLIARSRWEERDDNGNTTSGLITIMEPAYDGLDDHIDEFGASVIDDPIEPVMGSNGKWIKEGAKTKLLNARKQLEKDGDQDDLIAHIRDFPFNLAEALTKNTRQSGFNLKKCRERLREIQFERKGIPTRRGNLEWFSDFGGKVVFVDDPQGRFLFTQFPDDRIRNQMMWDSDAQHWFPNPDNCNKFVIGADPFMFGNKDVLGPKKSNGAICGFKNRDPLADPDDKPKDQWTSHCFNFTYSTRVEDKDIYCEDVLKACIFHSCFVFPEMNVPHVADNFRKWGFAGYLLHSTDEHGAKLPMPGAKVNTSESSKEMIFSDLMTHIENFVCIENHPELIQEWMDINGPKDMTNYDLFAASGAVMLGRKSLFPTQWQQEYQDYGNIGNITDVYYL